MPKDHVSRAAEILDKAWAGVRAVAQSGRLRDFTKSEELRQAMRRLISSRTKSYRYVLPTQLIAKLADRDLDCRCLQASRGGRGAFDARTVAHKVVVPFDQANDNVLGGSPEPYVNNPLRVPEVSAKYRSAQKNQADWDSLCSVLNAVEERADPLFAESLLKQVLTEIYRRLSQVRVTYPTPMRISLDRSLALIEQFLAQLSGGDRLLALASALFSVLGKRFRLYSDVRRASVTAADTATGMLADLECVSKKGRIVLAVEVKDRELTISQVKSKIPSIREKQVSEIFFVAQQGIAPQNQSEIEDLVAKEFVSGHNVYVMDLASLARVALALVGEEGRRDFIHEVGKQLDAYHSDVSHRRAWADLLSGV